ncbi:hypothetical protein CYMTET_17632, partial [Cymbomonas tetramitiformis]
VLPMYITCNPKDVATECDNPYDTRYRPMRLLLFDRQPGGIGIAAQAWPIFRELLQAAIELVEACECEEPSGCPACIHYLDCSEYNNVLDKSSALLVLKATVDAEVSILCASPPCRDDAGMTLSKS